MRPQTKVLSDAEREVGVGRSLDVEPVGIVKHAGIPIGRRIPQRDPVPFSQLHTVEFDVETDRPASQHRPGGATAAVKTSLFYLPSIGSRADKGSAALRIARRRARPML